MARINKTLLILALVSLAIFLFISLNLNLFSNINFTFNKFSESNQIEPFVTIAKIISYIFEPIYIIILIIIISTILYFKKLKKDAIFLALTSLIGGIIELAYKEITQIARPLNSLITETSSSFPSGHSMISVILFGFLIYFSIKHLKSKSAKITITILSALLILIIGLSRIYLNVHWFSDVLAGFALGAFILLFSILARKISEKN